MSSLAFLAARPLTARAQSWTDIGPNGAETTTLAVDPSAPSTVYLGTHSGGVFKTVDGGATWFSARNGLPTVQIVRLAIAPSDLDTVYAATAVGVYRTVDAGVTWTAANSPFDDDFIAFITVDPRDAQTVYTGFDNQGVSKSVNGGDSWEPMNDGFEGLFNVTARGIGIDPADPDNLYVATNRGVFKSVDGGPWAPASNGLPFANEANFFAFDPSNSQIVYIAARGGAQPSSVYRTDDGGEEWLPTGAELAFAPIREVLVAATTPTTLYILSGEGVWKTVDDGGHWEQKIAQLPPRRFGYGALALADTAGENLYVGYAHAAVPVYKSANGAQTWEAAGVERLRNTFVSSLAIDSTPQPTRYLVIEPHDSILIDTQRLLKRAASDTMWRPADTGLTEPTRVAVDPTDPNVLYAGTEHNGVFRSANGGQSWDYAATGVDEHLILCLAIDPTEPDTVYACGAPSGGGGFVYKTTTAGDLWLTRSTGLQDATATRGAPPLALVIDPSRPEVLFAATQGQGVFKSVDGALSWDEADSGISATVVRSLAIDPTATDTIYAGTNVGGVFKSVDGGTNWAPANGANGDIMATETVWTLMIDPTTRGTIYAGTENGVFRSRDGGASWKAIDEGLYSRSVRQLILDPNRPTHLTAGTYGGGVSEIGLACDGDCDRDGTVATSDLVLALQILLGEQGAEACRSLDANGDQQVDLAEVVHAVNIAVRSAC